MNLSKEVEHVICDVNIRQCICIVAAAILQLVRHKLQYGRGHNADTVVVVAAAI